MIDCRNDVEGKPDVVMTKGDYRGARGGQHTWRYILWIGLAAGGAFVASKDDEVFREPQKGFGRLRRLNGALLGGLLDEDVLSDDSSKVSTIFCTFSTVMVYFSSSMATGLLMMIWRSVPLFWGVRPLRQSELSITFQHLLSFSLPLFLDHCNRS